MKAIRGLVPIMLFLSFSMAFGAAGTTCTPENFKRASLDLLDRAIQNGWQQVGTSKLRDVRAQIASSRVRVDCNTKHLNITDGRWTARFDSQLNTIQVLPQSWETTERNALEGMSLHEYWGVLFRQDLNYNKTVAILHMAENPKEQNPALLLIASGNPDKGGSTGVGGGGDETDLRVRYEIFGALMRGYQKAKPVNEAARQRMLKTIQIATNIDIIYQMDADGIASPPHIASYTSKTDKSTRLVVAVGKAYFSEDINPDIDKALADVFQVVIDLSNKIYLENASR